METITEHRKIHSDIFIQGLLPFQIRISISFDNHTGPETVHQPIIKPIGSKGLERTEILIPGISDRGPETKHIDQL